MGCFCRLALKFVRISGSSANKLKEKRLFTSQLEVLHEAWNWDVFVGGGHAFICERDGSGGSGDSSSRD
jgi:hypothetical protein